MKDFVDRISYFEVGIIILCVVCMFFPFLRADVGSIHTTANAWHTIFGIDKSTTGINQFSSFSFLCLLVYLILFAIFLLNVFFDNKHNKVVDFAKILLFILAGILFVFYLRLINYSSYFTSFDEVKNFIKYRPGNYISSVLCFIGSIFAIIDFINDIKKD